MMTHKQKLILIFSSITVLVFCVFEFLSKSDWKLSYEEQAYLRCLPIELTLTHYREILPEEIERGMLVVVNTEGYEKFYREGVTLLKLVVAKPGDVVEINHGLVRVNGDFIAVYNTKDPKALKPFKLGTFTLEDNEYWISGSTDVSLDSRYIGPIGIERLIGKGYAII